VVNNSASVAVIDIGSNSIKMLVARRDRAGGLQTLKSRTLDARISAGIAQAKPTLSEEGMLRGLGAVRELVAEAGEYSPARVVLVATSAVRDAANGAVFRQRVKAAVKHDIRILTGEEEANYIGRGLTCDPALAELQDFYVFDLGGGSLECLSFEQRRIKQALSLQLGCVRLTEKFIKDPTAPVSIGALEAITAHVRNELAKSGFKFTPAPPAAVFTGGSMSAVRAIEGAKQGRRLEQTPALIEVPVMRDLLAVLAPMTLAQRKTVPGLPAARADVFPAALATMLAVADAAGLEQFHHSLHNLRYGLAAELLAN
jgi:exopolyphosphatase/guanosine-5'-triphosphate,3'-diphosphate pyrophosphatase